VSRRKATPPSPNTSPSKPSGLSPIPYFDPITGEEHKAYLFVAALPCSSYLYVEACTDMKIENWLMCHIHAYAYFGGVTRILVPDDYFTVRKAAKRNTESAKSLQGKQ